MTAKVCAISVFLRSMSRLILFIIINLLYNFVLFSAGQQSESATCIHTVAALLQSCPTV